MTALNVPLLKQTITHIGEHPESWDQGHYRCRTGMCFAGWAVELDGGTWHKAEPEGPWADELIACPDDPDDDVFTLSDGTRLVHAEARATRILGLTEDEADELFAASNTFEDLRQIVADLCMEAS